MFNSREARAVPPISFREWAKGVRRGTIDVTWSPVARVFRITAAAVTAELLCASGKGRQVVSQFLSGTQTRRIGPLVKQYPEPHIEMHLRLAAKLGIQDGIGRRPRHAGHPDAAGDGRDCDPARHDLHPLSAGAR